MPKGIPGKAIIICADCGNKREHEAKGSCKSCYGRWHYQKNKGKYQQYYQENKEKVCANSKAWRQKNPDYSREWARRNSSRIREGRYRNRKKILANYERYCQDNREAGKICQLQHRKKNSDYSIAFMAGYVRGFFDADGTIGLGTGVVASNIEYRLLRRLQLYLLCLSVDSSLLGPYDQKGNRKSHYMLRVPRGLTERFARVVGFFHKEKVRRLNFYRDKR